ncbi:peptidoglycan DD-metalloendopeptidase family protein [Pannus brasiliensis CCIBt3594]|uniref:Peptidoglycan DD-metalloendopeptidase family protein n=1 Tax=Pannus brasiliensis CCIBt3594 TaxID=1427578 RepID=A0AAW9QYC0_9CHRO
MRQSSVIRKFLFSNSSRTSLGVLGLISLALVGSIGLPNRATAGEVGTETVPTLKPPVPIAAETVSEPSGRLAIPENHRTDMPTLAPRQTASGKNNFIDTRNYAPPTEVVVTGRSGGCQTIARGGQLVGGRCAAAPVASAAPRQRQRLARVAKPLPPVNLTAIRRSRPDVRQTETVAVQPRRQRIIAENPVAVQPRRQRIIAENPVAVQPRRRIVTENVASRIAPTLVASTAPVRLAAPRVIPSEVGTVVPLNPPEWNGVKLALAPVTRPVEAYPTVEPAEESATIDRATSLSPTVSEQPQRTDLLFPLAIPARITSVFGWRQHPISGREAMHAGTDLGAPTGTPVLAAYPGEVVTADWVGGYGLMVILRHLDGTQESRYGHLSEINVTPGQHVEQGEMIGRVGSTGMSTGPHLHFEWRHLTEQGWTAVDAGLHLEFALDNLIQQMRIATTDPAPETNNPNQG